MKVIILKYWADSFWRHNIIFFLASLFIALLNYIYYPILGRLMAVSNFGEVQTLLTIINIFGMLISALQIVIINMAANSARHEQKNNEIINQFEHAALIIMFTVFILLAGLSPLLKITFKFSSSWPFIMLGLALIVGVSNSFRRGYLQGRRNFIATSISGILFGSGKVIFSSLLVVIGWQTIGAIAGLLIAQLIALTYCAKIAKKIGFRGLSKQDFNFSKLAILKPQIGYLAIVLVVSLVSVLLLNGDVLIVKKYFNPEIAGQYAGISAIAKTVYFVTASFSGVLLASVGLSFTGEHNRRIIQKSFGLVTLVGGLVLAAFYLFPTLVIETLLGSRYLSLAHLLPNISTVIYLAALVNLCFYYLIAMRNKIVFPIALAGGALTLSLTWLRHGSVEAVVQNLFIGAFLLLIILLGLAVYNYLKLPGKATA